MLIKVSGGYRGVVFLLGCSLLDILLILGLVLFISRVLMTLVKVLSVTVAYEGLFGSVLYIEKVRLE